MPLHQSLQDIAAHSVLEQLDPLQRPEDHAQRAAVVDEKPTNPPLQNIHQAHEHHLFALSAFTPTSGVPKSCMVRS
jgi:hypothetical protein